jgi:hypothetical protein
MAGANTTPLRADDVPKKSVVNEVSGACDLCVSNMRQGKNVQYGLGERFEEMLASILPRSRIRCHSCRQARNCGSRLDRLQTLRRTSYGHSGYIHNRWLSANDLPPGAEGSHVSLLLQLPNVGRSKAGWRAMVRGRTKNACSEELQRFRRPLHSHWDNLG